MEQPPEKNCTSQEPPPQKKPMGIFTMGGARKPFPEPKPVPQWMINLGECALFGMPVLLLILPFGPRLPEFGLAAPLPAIIDLTALLVVVFGAGAGCRAFVLSPRGADLRRFGARAKRWYAAGPNRSLLTYLALLGLWGTVCQLPRLTGWSALIFAGTLVFCLAAAFVLFTAGLIVAAGEERSPAAEDSRIGPDGGQDGRTSDTAEEHAEGSE